MKTACGLEDRLLSWNGVLQLDEFEVVNQAEDVSEKTLRLTVIPRVGAAVCPHCGGLCGEAHQTRDRDGIRGTFIDASEPQLCYFLPRETQWEFAARAGTTGHFGTSDAPTIKPKSELASESSVEPGPHTVATTSQNPFGLYGMLGNVREMCADRSLGNHSLGVVRGGS